MADKENNNSEKNISRRDILKGIATTPILGVFAYDFYKKQTLSKLKDKAINFNLGISDENPKPQVTEKSNGELVRIGVIGTGGRATALLKALGFADKKWYDELYAKAKAGDKGAKQKLETYHNQEVLNVNVVGVCDVFDMRAENAINIASKGIQPNGEPINLQGVKRYLRYQEMLASSEIDAVIIATPDFHHAHMTIDAVKAGKHVYCEKAMTLNEDELHEVYATVKKSDIVFQLGHQNSKNESFKKAKEIIDKNILGKITLVEATTNRNSKG